MKSSNSLRAIATTAALSLGCAVALTLMGLQTPRRFFLLWGVLTAPTGLGMIAGGNIERHRINATLDRYSAKLATDKAVSIGQYSEHFAAIQEVQDEINA